MWFNRFVLMQRLTSLIILRRSNHVNTNSEPSQIHPTDLYHWNIAMTESNKRQTPEKTLVLFEKLIHEYPEINPNFITYLLVLGACIRLGNLHEGKRIHQYIEKRWSTTVDSNEAVKVQTCLVQLYATCGDLKTAEQIFFKSNLHQRAIPVNTMMKGYLIHHRTKAAIELAEALEKNERNSGTYLLWANAVAQSMDSMMANRIHQELETLTSATRTVLRRDCRLMNALINMDGKCGNIERMEKTFHTMEQPDIITFTTLAKAYVTNDLPLKALNIYDHLKTTHCVPCDEVMYLVVSNAAGKLGLLSRARSIHQDIIADGFAYENNIKILNTLMDTYGKCGDLQSAREIFNRMKNPTKPSLSSMINIYGINSHALEAVALFYENKEKLSGNIQSILTSVLTACAHGGLVQEAQKIFDEIPEEKRSVKIWNILVDVYGRAGLLDEAYEVIRRFEIHHSRVAVLHISLLAACRVQKNVPLAMKIYDELISSKTPLNEDQRSAIFVLIANVHSSIGDHHRSIEFRENLSKEKLPKYTGVTWTEIDGKTYEFSAHDTRHPRTKEIYHQLEILHEQLKSEGYQPNESVVTSNDHPDRESSLYGHSERLAIGWNLISTPPGTTIRLTKNLRMCVDCHEVSKLIARLTQREIFVRDRLRIHHFNKQGRCSCDNHF